MRIDLSAVITSKSAYLAFSIALLSIWNIPGTIALRTLFLLVLLAIFITRKREVSAAIGAPKIVLFIVSFFGIYTAWAVFHTAFLAVEPAWSLSELLGQFPRQWIAIVVGVGFGAFYWRSGFFILKAIFFLSVVAHLLDNILFFLATGNDFKSTEITGRLFGQKVMISYICNMYAAIVAAEILSEVYRGSNNRKRYFQLALELLFIAVATYFIGARNGYVGLIFLIISSTFMAAFLLRDAASRHGILILLSGILIASVITTSTFLSDSRWQGFVASASTALDPSMGRGWLTNEFPEHLVNDGIPDDHSAYVRISGIRGAVEAAYYYPLGYGFGRNAFGHAWQSLAGGGKGTSLSGLGDVLVALGIPGVITFMLLIGSVVVGSIDIAFKFGSREGFLLIFLGTGFLGRSLVESNIRDHSLEFFLFLLAAFGVMGHMKYRSTLPGTGSSDRVRQPR